MKVYKCFAEKPREELGELSVEQVFALLQEISAREATAGPGEDDFGIGLARSEDDFVEINYLGEEKYLIWSDRLRPVHSGTVLVTTFTPRTGQIEAMVKGEQGARDAVLLYLQQPREVFERTFG
jgi:hypothetical protein